MQVLTTYGVTFRFFCKYQIVQPSPASINWINWKTFSGTQLIVHFVNTLLKIIAMVYCWRGFSLFTCISCEPKKYKCHWRGYFWSPISAMVSLYICTWRQSETINALHTVGLPFRNTVWNPFDSGLLPS